MLLNKCFDSVEIHREEKIIIFKLLQPYRLISTCRIGGGLREDVRFVCNHQCCEPCDHFTSINSMMVEDPELIILSFPIIMVFHRITQ